MSTCSVVKLMDTLRVICKEISWNLRSEIRHFAILVKMASKCKQAVNGKVTNASYLWNIKLTLSWFTWVGEYSFCWWSVSEVNEMDLGSALVESHSSYSLCGWQVGSVSFLDVVGVLLAMVMRDGGPLQMKSQRNHVNHFPVTFNGIELWVKELLI